MKKLLALILLIAFAFGGWYVASPWLALTGLADAVRAGDMEEIRDRVDFPALRASAADEIAEATRRRIGRGDVLGRIGGAVAGVLGREVGREALTPQVITDIVLTGTLGRGLLRPEEQDVPLDFDIRREGLTHFRAVGVLADGSEGPTLIFRRDGLSWDLSGIDLPDRQ